jgi:hypothetical protein
MAYFNNYRESQYDFSSGDFSRLSRNNAHSLDTSAFVTQPGTMTLIRGFIAQCCFYAPSLDIFKDNIFDPN